MPEIVIATIALAIRSIEHGGIPPVLLERVRRALGLGDLVHVHLVPLLQTIAIIIYYCGKAAAPTQKLQRGVGAPGR